MENKRQYKPDYAIPPALTLREIVGDIGITYLELSEQSGVPYTTLLEVKNATQPITQEIADGLAKALNVPSSFWLNLEKNYQETVTRLQQPVRGSH